MGIDVLALVVVFAALALDRHHDVVAFFLFHNPSPGGGAVGPTPGGVPPTLPDPKGWRSIEVSMHYYINLGLTTYYGLGEP